MDRVNKVISLPIIEPCDCFFCLKGKRSYVYRFIGTFIYFYLWEYNGKLFFIYVVECPYKTDWDDFSELTFEEAFDLLPQEYKDVIIFNLDLFK